MAEPLSRRSSKPATDKPANTLEERINENQEWIAEANTVPAAYPWDNANIRIEIGYNIKIDEPTYKKLQWIAEREPKGSVRKLLLEGIDMIVEKKLKHYLREENKNAGK